MDNTPGTTQAEQVAAAEAARKDGDQNPKPEPKVDEVTELKNRIKELEATKTKPVENTQATKLSTRVKELEAQLQMERAKSKPVETMPPTPGPHPTPVGGVEPLQPPTPAPSPVTPPGTGVGSPTK